MEFLELLEKWCCPISLNLENFRNVVHCLFKLNFVSSIEFPVKLSQMDFCQPWSSMEASGFYCVNDAWFSFLPAAHMLLHSWHSTGILCYTSRKELVVLGSCEMQQMWEGWCLILPFPLPRYVQAEIRSSLRKPRLHRLTLYQLARKYCKPWRRKEIETQNWDVQLLLSLMYFLIQRCFTLLD